MNVTVETFICTPVSRTPSKRIGNWIKNVFGFQDKTNQPVKLQFITMIDNYHLLVIQKEFGQKVTMVLNMDHHLNCLSTFLDNNWKTETFLHKKDDICFWYCSLSRQVELLLRMFHINVHELNFSKHIIQSIIYTINKANNITNVASLTKYKFMPPIQNVFQFLFLDNFYIARYIQVLLIKFFHYYQNNIKNSIKLLHIAAIYRQFIKIPFTMDPNAV